MAKRFVLTCLGHPELRTAEGKVVRIRVKKHLALLVYLAVERRQGHSRTRLVDLFWGRVQPTRGRHSCATALSFLRGIFGKAAFTATRDMVRFHPAELALDLDPLAKGEIIGPDGEAVIDVDGFLRGFELDDCPEWSLWKEREHSHRMPAIHAGLLTLIDHGRRRGSHEEIMRRAERLLALDHLAEEGVRAKMEALALVGDRFSALRVFDEWKEQLAGELRAEPSGLVEGMASQLRKRGWEPKEPNPIPAVPAEQWRDRKFVGRRAEYRVLYETWEAVHQFEPRYLLIAGDSGVGKTTLAQRLVTAAGMEGASVSRVQCYQMEQRIPFAAIGGLVTGLLGRPGLAATSPEALAEVGRLVPGVKTHFPHLPPPKQGEGESARLLFAEGVIDLLTAVMEERPLLLVVDDIHNADEASLAVLHLVIRRLTEGRMLAVLTTRADADRAAPATRIIEAAPRIATVRIELNPMPNGDCTLLLESILSRRTPTPSPPERRALVRASHGFPMVLELLALDWITNGTNCAALALRAFTAEFRQGPTQQTDPFPGLVDRLLGEIGDSARKVLSLAAILGPQLGELDFYSIIDLSLGQTLEGLSELTSRRVLRDIGSGLEFMNELVRAHVYRSVPTSLRTHIHAAIADRLLARTTTPQPDLEIAWHLIRAHRATEATPHLLRGARTTLTRGAPDEVVLALSSSVPDLALPTRDEATLLWVEALHELARWSEALSITSAMQGPSEDKRFRLLFIEERWRLALTTLDEEREIVGELLGYSDKSDGVGVEAVKLAAFIASSIRDDALMNEVSAKIPTNQAVEPCSIAALLMAKAHLAYHARYLDEGEAAAIQARERMTSLGVADSNAAKIEVGIGAFRTARGDYTGAAAQAEKAIAIANKLDNEAIRNMAIANAANCYWRLGAYERAIGHASTLNEEADLLAVRIASAAAACSLATMGRSTEALNIVERTDRRMSLSPYPWMVQYWFLERADILWLSGQKAKAMRSAAEGTSGVYGHPLARGNTGAFVRWSAKMRNDDSRLRAVIQSAVTNRSRLDYLDWYEVCGAIRTTGEAVSGLSETELATEIRKAEAVLPQATLDFLYGVTGSSQ